MTSFLLDCSFFYTKAALLGLLAGLLGRLFGVYLGVFVIRHYTVGERAVDHSHRI